MLVSLTINSPHITIITNMGGKGYKIALWRLANVIWDPLLWIDIAATQYESECMNE